MQQLFFDIPSLGDWEWKIYTQLPEQYGNSIFPIMPYHVGQYHIGNQGPIVTNKYALLLYTGRAGRGKISKPAAILLKSAAKPRTVRGNIAG